MSQLSLDENFSGKEVHWRHNSTRKKNNQIIEFIVKKVVQHGKYGLKTRKYILSSIHETWY